MEQQGWVIITIAVICIIVLLVAIKKKVEWIMNLLLRTILGVLAIILINKGLYQVGYDSGVGLNPWTVLTSGILGFPGLALLYGICFYKSL